ncbi:MAG: hypothetical protein K0S45_3210 [Nitrospira sp.]|jgi:hypothetical protein|nr:hypothetical protein [Nitrospira sp.]
MDGQPIATSPLSGNGAVQDQLPSTAPSLRYIGQELISIVFVRAQNRFIGKEASHIHEIAVEGEAAVALATGACDEKSPDR